MEAVSSTPHETCSGRDGTESNPCASGRRDRSGSDVPKTFSSWRISPWTMCFLMSVATSLAVLTRSSNTLGSVSTRCSSYADRSLEWETEIAWESPACKQNRVRRRVHLPAQALGGSGKTSGSAKGDRSEGRTLEDRVAGPEDLAVGCPGGRLERRRDGHRAGGSRGSRGREQERKGVCVVVVDGVAASLLLCRG